MKNQNLLAKIFAIVFGVIGLVFLIGGLIFLYTYLNVNGDYDFMVMAYVFVPIGGVFSLVAACSLIVAISGKRRIERLMRDGVRYDADIVRIYEKPYTHVNYRSPLVVECGYKDSRGRSYLVKSRNVWMTQLVSRDDIRARVWVNPDKPKDYYVEVYFASEMSNTNMKYDFDYR